MRARKPRNDLFESILAKVVFYFFHSDQRWYTFFVSFVIATYYHRMFSPFPHWVLQGVRASGKTTAATLVGELCWNPTPPQLGLRSAPFFRLIEDSRPTFIVDITRFSYKDLDLTDLLEVVDPQAVVSRCAGEKNEEIRVFHPFSPKVVTVRQNVPFSDKAIETLTESAPQGSVYSERRIYIPADPDLKTLVGSILRGVICNWKMVYEAYESTKQDKRLFGRRFELWRPFLAVCKAYAPDRYQDLLGLAYEDAERAEKGDVTSDVENALIGYLLMYDRTKPSKEISLKDLTNALQERLGDYVVKSYHIVKSALKNTRLAKKNFTNRRGDAMVQVDLFKARILAKERNIDFEAPSELSKIPPLCPLCGTYIYEGVG